MNRSKHAAPTSQVIDGVSGDLQIVELWSAKCENLHNPCNPDKSVRVLEDVMSVSEDDLVSLSIDADTVSRSISQLKPRKSDGKSL